MFSISDDVSNSSAPCDHPLPWFTPYLTIVSCLVSLLGSFLVVLTFALWKEFRSIGRSILVFLAITDFFTALGYMFGAAVTLSRQEMSSSLYTHMCVAQSFITSFFPVSSFIWTLNLAIYLLAVLVLRKEGRTIWKLLIAFHLAAWGIPLVVCFLGIGLNQFGPNNASLTSVHWCFIKYDGKNKVEYFIFEAVCGKFWEIVTYVVSLVIYIVVKRKSKLVDIKALPQAKYWSIKVVQRVTSAASQLDGKLMWVPIVFILIRIWGTLRFLISFSCDLDCIGSCPADNIFLVVMQSIFDPAQGWSNALLFVVFHKPVLNRMCPCVLKVYDTLCLFCSRCPCCKRDGLRSPLLGNNKGAERNTDSVNED